MAVVGRVIYLSVFVGLAAAVVGHVIICVCVFVSLAVAVVGRVIICLYL